MKWTKSFIKFNVDLEPKEFFIIHNLPETFGQSITEALDNWLARTEDFTDSSFVNYINSKDTEHIAMTEDEYKMHQ